MKTNTSLWFRDANAQQTIVDSITNSSGGGLPTEKAVADVLCSTVWTGSLELNAAMSNTRFTGVCPVTLSKDNYIVFFFTGYLAQSSSSSSGTSIDFAAILKPAADAFYNDAHTTISVAQRMSSTIVLNANIILTFTTKSVRVDADAVGTMPYIKTMTLKRIDVLAKII